MHLQRLTIPVTVDASGDATVYSAHISGKIQTIRYVKADFADGVDFTLTAEDTGETIWAESDVNASATRAPRQPTHSTEGSAALYAAAGSAVNDHIAIANDRIKIVVAQGGVSKSGTIIIIIC